MIPPTLKKRREIESGSADRSNPRNAGNFDLTKLLR